MTLENPKNEIISSESGESETISESPTSTTPTKLECGESQSLKPIHQINTIDKQLNDVEESINHWEDEKGICRAKPPKNQDEIQELLDMSSEERRGLTPDECGEAAITLNLYCNYINRVSQAQYSNSIWAKERLSHLIAKHEKNYKGFTYGERADKVTANEGVELDKKRIYCEMRSLRLKDMAKWIGEVAKSFQVLSQIRRGR